MRIAMWLTVIVFTVGTGSLFAEQQETTQVLVPGPQPAAEPAAATTTPSSPQETVWLDDELPVKAGSEGNWVWDTETVMSGKKSHGHPSGKGLQSHGLTGDPVTFTPNTMVTQQVWLDPKDPPKGIMLKFKLASTGEEVGVYWEGEEEVFLPAEEEEVWYYGLLPELGQWATLEVLAEDLGLDEEQVSGIRFMTFDGRALWDKTTLTQAPPAAGIEDFPEFPELSEPAASSPTPDTKY